MTRLLTLLICLGLAGCSTMEWDRLRALVMFDDQKVIDDPNVALANGRRLFADGSYGLAINAFNAALTFEPESVRALNGLAASYDKIGRFDLAQRYYGEALALAPEAPATLNNIGYSKLLQGQVEQALVYFERAAQHDPDSARIAANSQLASAIIARENGRAPREDVTVAALDKPTVRRMWIEQTAERVHTLITRPDPKLVEQAAALDVDPRLVSFNGARQN